jgi:hypothetical protein
MTPLIIGGAVGAVGLTALALRARARRKAVEEGARLAANAKLVQGQPIATPTQTQAALNAAGVKVTDFNQDPVVAQQIAQAVVGSAIASGDNVADAILQGTAVTGNGGASSNVQQAIVTTNDPPPSGDLRILDAPNGTQIGGAEKNGVVTVFLDFSDPTFAKITWPGGSRLPAASGFVRKAFLRLV